MSKSRKHLGAKTALLVVAALCLSASAGASAASALQPTWMELANGTSAPATLSGTLQVKLQLTGTPVSCPVVASGVARNGATGGADYAANSLETCSNGEQFQVNMSFRPSAIPGGWAVTVYPPVGPPQAQLSPFQASGSGAWQQSQNTTPVALTNGAGGSPTTLTFNNTKLGDELWSGYKPLYATGTLSLTRPTGGTLTVGLR